MTQTQLTASSTLKDGSLLVVLTGLTALYVSAFTFGEYTTTGVKLLEAVTLIPVVDADLVAHKQTLLVSSLTGMVVSTLLICTGLICRALKHPGIEGYTMPIAVVAFFVGIAHGASHGVPDETFERYEREPILQSNIIVRHLKQYADEMEVRNRVLRNRLEAEREAQRSP
jgi:hypothetical protein